jgi:hypothetical protein
MNWLTTSCPYSTLMRSWDVGFGDSHFVRLPADHLSTILSILNHLFIFCQDHNPHTFFRQWVFVFGTKWLSFSNLNSWLHVHSRCVNIVLCLQIRLGLCIRKNGQSERLIKAVMYCDGTWMSNNPSLGRNISERCVGFRILLWGSDIGQ